MYVRLKVSDSLTSCEGCKHALGTYRSCWLYQQATSGIPCPDCLAAREDGTPAERLGVTGEASVMRMLLSEGRSIPPSALARILDALEGKP